MAYLIEGERYEIGEGLSPAVDKAVDRLIDLLLEKLAPPSAGAATAKELLDLFGYDDRRHDARCEPITAARFGR
jgi:hypothetical protein